jgi:long-chain fatty acid transport protein
MQLPLPSTAAHGYGQIFSSQQHPIPYLVLSILLLCAPDITYAGSPYQPEIGTPGSNGTAGAANPTNINDASALRTNPAGLVHIEEPNSLLVGAQVLTASMRFDTDIATAGGDDGGNAGPLEFIPSVFYSRSISEQLHFGVGLAPAYGLGADYGESFRGRYSTIESNFVGAGFYSSLGYKLGDEWAVGLSIAAIYTTLELSRAVSTTPFAPNAATDGKVTLDELDDWSPQATLGLMYRPDNGPWTLGFVYRSKTEVDVEGDVDFEGLPMPSAKGSASFDMPESYEIGLTYQYSDQLRLFVETDIQRWSQFSNYTVDLGTGPVAYDRSWRDSYRFAVGAEYKLAQNETLYIGTSYDMSPVRDKHRTFDAPTDEQIRLSGAYVRQHNSIEWSAGLSIIFSDDGSVDQVAEITPGTGLTARTAGEFSSYYLMFPYVSFRYIF